MPLKRYDIAFQAQTGNQVTPDEVDRYEVYSVVNPAISATFFGTTTPGTVSQAVTHVLANTVADYPRTVGVFLSGSASVSGSAVVTGKDQFGATRSETVGVAQGTQVVGTATGTIPFANLTSVVTTFGTGVIGTGTASVGVAIGSASALFGLPVKIGSTSDVKSITWTKDGLAVALNGGTVSSYVGTANHTFRGTATSLAGTMSYQVWVKSTWTAQGDNMDKISNL